MSSWLLDDDELTIQVALTEGEEYRDFNPDQPRDEHGRWRRTGTAVGITPNTEMVGSFGEAAAKWADADFQHLAAKFEDDMAKKMPGKVTFHRQIGMWQGEWEPSYEVRVRDAPGSDAHKAAEQVQHDYGQEGIVSFDYGGGDDAVITLGGFGDPDAMGKVLVENGMPGSSFSLDGNTASVILQNDAAGSDALGVLLSYADKNGLNVTYEFGRARGLGGNDGEAQAQAGQADAPRAAGGGRALEGVNGERRDHLDSAAWTEEEAALVESWLFEWRDFNPAQPRDSHGRWSRVGGGVSADFAPDVSLSEQLQVKAALDAANRLLPLPNLKIKVRHMTPHDDKESYLIASGRYVVESNDLAINWRSKEARPKFMGSTILHEFAHYLDANQVLGPRENVRVDLASQDPVRGSRLHNLVRQLRRSTPARYWAAQTPAPHAEYMIRAEELLARSFVQYLAEREHEDAVANHRPPALFAREFQAEQLERADWYWPDMAEFKHEWENIKRAWDLLFGEVEDAQS